MTTKDYKSILSLIHIIYTVLSSMTITGNYIS